MDAAALDNGQDREPKEKYKATSSSMFKTYRKRNYKMIKKHLSQKFEIGCIIYLVRTVTQKKGEKRKDVSAFKIRTS